MSEYCTLTDTTSSSFVNCHKDMLASVNSISPPLDYNQFVEKYRLVGLLE